MVQKIRAVSVLNVMDTFFYDEAICICCGHEVTLVCDVCDANISPSEILGFEGTCSYCTYRWEKMQDE